MLYVVTENNTLYAIEADSPYSKCLSVSLNQSGANADTAIPVSVLPTAGNPPMACNNLTGSSAYGTVGVTGTPVIDPNQNVLFVVSSHQGGTAGNYTYTQRLTAVDVTKLIKLNTLDLPTSVNAARPTGYPKFYGLNESQRSGLLLTKSGSTGANVYVGWGTFCDSNISSGGSFGLVSEFDFDYSTSTFGAQAENFYAEGKNTNLVYTPNAPAGTWMSGGAPAADGAGNVYVAIGNGKFEGVSTPLNFGNSIVKLGGSTFGEEDFYTPNVWSALNFGASNISCGTDYLCTPCPPCTIALSSGDWDLGSGGVVLLAASNASVYGQLAAAGKDPDAIKALHSFEK